MAMTASGTDVKESHSLALFLFSQDESSPLEAQHFEWGHTLDAQANAGIRDLDLFYRRGSFLMCYNGVSMRKRLRHKIIIRDLADCGLWIGDRGLREKNRHDPSPISKDRNGGGRGIPA